MNLWIEIASARCARLAMTSTPPRLVARLAVRGRGNTGSISCAIASMLARVMSSGSVPNWVLVSDVLKPARSWYAASFSRTVLGLPTMTTPASTRSSAVCGLPVGLTARMRFIDLMLV